MATANVSVTFECSDQADAQKKLEKWKLHEGCKVIMQVTEMGVPREADDKGNIVPAPEPAPPEPVTLMEPTAEETEIMAQTADGNG